MVGDVNQKTSDSGWELLASDSANIFQRAHVEGSDAGVRCFECLSHLREDFIFGYIRIHLRLQRRELFFGKRAALGVSQ